MRVLWITGAVMELASAIAYGALGLSVVFCLLEGYVVATVALTTAELVLRHRGGNVARPGRREWYLDNHGSVK